MKRITRIILMILLYACLFAASFFLVTYFNGYAIFKPRNITTFNPLIIQLIIGLVTLLGAIVILYFLLRRNHEKLIERADSELTDDDEYVSEKTEYATTSDLKADNDSQNDFHDKTAENEYNEVTNDQLTIVSSETTAESSVNEQPEEEEMVNDAEPAEQEDDISEELATGQQEIVSVKEDDQDAKESELPDNIVNFGDITPDYSVEIDTPTNMLEAKSQNAEAEEIVEDVLEEFSVERPSRRESADSQIYRPKMEFMLDDEPLTKTQISYINNSSNSYINTQGMPQLVMTDNLSANKVKERAEDYYNQKAAEKNDEPVQTETVTEEEVDDSFYIQDEREESLINILGTIALILFVVFIGIVGYYLYSRYLG